MATINGKPSVFKSVETPTEKHPIYETRIADFAANAKEMAEAEAEKHTLCEHCQAEMVKWRLANPNATKLEAEDARYEIWQQCPPCSADFAEWCEEVDEQWRNDPEAYEAHLEAEAEAHDLESLGDGYLHAINGDDEKWQQGGHI